MKRIGAWLLALVLLAAMLPADGLSLSVHAGTGNNGVYFYTTDSSTRTATIIGLHDGNARFPYWRVRYTRSRDRR